MSAVRNRIQMTLRGIVLLAVVFACVLAISPRAEAQGTFGSFADPVTSQELDLYARRLGLSDEQYRTFLSAHDAYKEDFQELREGAIEEFMQEQREMQAAMRIPQREAMEKFVEGAEKLNKKIASLDNRLFDSVAPMLTEQQQALLPRIRMHRERKRYSGNNMMRAVTGGGQFVDLSELILEMELSGEQLAPVDPLLAQYERRLTGKMGELHEASTRMYVDMVDAFEEAGLADLDFSDPEVMQERMEQMQAIMEKVFADIRQKGLELTELNDKSYENLADVLGGEAGRDLRDHYIAKTYPRATFALDTNGTQFDVALDVEDLTDEQRSAIEAAAAGYRSKMDQLLSKTLEVIREFRANRSLMNPMGSMRDQREKMNELEKQAERMVEQADEALYAILNEQQGRRYAALAQKQLQKRMEEGLGGYSSSISKRLSKLADKEAGRAGGQSGPPDAPPEASDSQVVQMIGLDQFVPGGIAQHEIHGYAEKLDLDDGERAVLKELHGSYVERLRQIRNSEGKAVREVSQAISSLWGSDDESRKPVDGSDVDKLMNLRQQAFNAVKQADQAFFNDVDLVLTTDAQRETLKRLRADRKRQRLQDTGVSAFMSFAMFGGNNRAAAVDLRSLVEQQGFDAQQKKQIDTILDERERKLIDLLEQQYETALEAEAAQQKWMIKQWEAQNNDESAAAFNFEEYRELVGKPQTAALEIRKEIVALNEATLDEMRTKLGADATASLQQTYQKRAYPDVYQDSWDVAGKLEKSLALNDLSESQRTQVQNLAANYHSTFNEHAKKLLELRRNSPGSMMDMQRENWQKIMEHQQSIQKIEFARDELASRTITELKIILNEDQIKRIGGLPEISDDDGAFRVYQ